MFGKNEIVGKKYFNEATIEGDKLFVTSIFLTLQGEGPLRGQVACFVRLAKCNLACSFCDTFFDDGDWLTFAEIEDRIETIIDSYFNSIGIDRPSYAVISDENPQMDMALVITGGEPMLQTNLPKFLDEVSMKFRYTQIESNGTVYQDLPVDTILVVSPKCSEKLGKAIKYLKPREDVLDRADCLKFVMEADPESPYSNVPQWALDWKREDVKREIYVSPMNIYNDIPAMSKKKRVETNQISIEERSTVDEVVSFWEPGLLNMEENQKNHEYAAKYCIANGLILNLQIHLYASLA